LIPFLSLGYFENLQTLDLSCINLTPEVTKRFPKLSQLRNLDLARNPNLKNTCFLLQFTKLEKVCLDYCGIETFPVEIGSFFRRGGGERKEIYYNHPGKKKNY